MRSDYSDFARSALRLISVVTCAGMMGCTSLPEREGPPRKEFFHAVTESHQLIKFNAGQPQKILERKAISGLQPGEKILGIDYRVARGILYALGDSGRLYTINTTSGAATQVGKGTFAAKLDGAEFGFDFNPTVDRIRVVSITGQNLRLHPDTGAVVDSDDKTPGLQTDGPLAFAAGDPNAGKTPRIAAAAYTYNKVNDKITTNFAIDAALGLLVTQGTREGVTPAVSPNSGQIYTVGALGVGTSERVAFDIADVSGAGFAAFTRAGESRSRFYWVDLVSGAATFIGTIGGGEAVRGISFEP